MTQLAMQIEPVLNGRFQIATGPDLGRDAVKILLVEDDKAVLEELCDVIFLEGWTPIAAPTVETALTLLEEDPHIRVVVTDVHFAKGKDCANGIQFLSRARAKFTDRALSFIVLSGDPSSVGSTQLEGAFQFLPKPLVPEHLIASVELAMNTGDGEPETDNVIFLTGDRK